MLWASSLTWLLWASLLLSAALAAQGPDDCCDAAQPSTYTSKKASQVNAAFIIGVQKSGRRGSQTVGWLHAATCMVSHGCTPCPCTGTTFLYDELVARHPKIRPWRNKSVEFKEPHFFDTLLGDLDRYVDGFHAITMK
jgi:hypothetical protein